MNTLKSILANHPFVKGLPPAHLEILIECAQETRFGTDQIIFREGEIADKFYLIQQGTVALESSAVDCDTIVIQTLGADEALGWSWLFPPFFWHLQARAMEPTSVIEFNGAHLLIACDRNHDLGYELTKRCSQIVIQRLQATRRQFLLLPNLRHASSRKTDAPLAAVK